MHFSYLNAVLLAVSVGIASAAPAAPAGCKTVKNPDAEIGELTEYLECPNGLPEKIENNSALPISYGKPSAVAHWGNLLNFVFEQPGPNRGRCSNEHACIENINPDKPDSTARLLKDKVEAVPLGKPELVLQDSKKWIFIYKDTTNPQNLCKKQFCTIDKSSVGTA